MLRPRTQQALLQKLGKVCVLLVRDKKVVIAYAVARKDVFYGAQKFLSSREAAVFKQERHSPFAGDGTSRDFGNHREHRLFRRRTNTNETLQNVLERICRLFLLLIFPRNQNVPRESLENFECWSRRLSKNGGSFLRRRRHSRATVDDALGGGEREVEKKILEQYEGITSNDVDNY